MPIVPKASATPHCTDRRSKSPRFIRLYCATFAAWIAVCSLLPPAGLAEDALDLSRLPGLVQPKQVITVFSNTPGVIAQLLVHDGQQVERGDPLLRLDDTLIRTAVAAARVSAESTGQIDFAKAEVQMAIDNYERIKSVSAHHAIAAREVAAAKAAVEKAQANLVAACETVEVARLRSETEQVRLQQHTSLAPFSGIVTQLRAVEGQKVADDTPLMQLVNLDVLTTELQVPLSAYGRLQAGELCPLQPESPIQQAVVARIVSVSPVLDAGTQSARCVLEIDNADHRLPAGFLVFGPTWWYDEPAAAESVSASDQVEPEQGPELERAFESELPGTQQPERIQAAIVCWFRIQTLLAAYQLCGR